MGSGSQSRSSKHHRNHAMTSMATAAPPSDEKPRESSKKCPACEKSCTQLEKCSTFKKMSVDERLKVLRKIQGCFNCFRPNHVAKDCHKAKGCQVPDCNLKHHALLHRWSNSVTVSATKSSTGCYLGVIPVTVEASGKRVKTYALLDNGSQKTLCTGELINRQVRRMS